MLIRFDHILHHWYPRRDQLEWVLATVVKTKRSTYRKAGAKMLINGNGEYFGMLSGGCLERDLLLQAKKVFASNQPLSVSYDFQEDNDSLWQASLGCGGEVQVLLQPVNKTNHYLGLDKLHVNLADNKTVVYCQRIDTHTNIPPEWSVLSDDDTVSALLPELSSADTCIVENQGTWLQTLLRPTPQLLIFGGGLDAAPIAKIAQAIGWKVILVDKRQGYAKAPDFPGATIFREDIQTIAGDTVLEHIDAVVIIHHHIGLDSEALLAAKNSSAKYIGVLGPQHRREKVEQLAGVTPSEFNQYYCGPMGLDIGAQLPETIALAIIAEIHKVIEGKN